MEKKISGSKVIAAVSAFLIITALFTTISLVTRNNSLRKNLGSEKLNSEKLLAEKLSLDKDIAQFNAEMELFKLDMNKLKGKNNEMDNLLVAAQQTLSQKQAEINRLAKSVAGKKTIEKELAELKRMKDNYENQIIKLKNQLDTLNSDNNSLSEENTSLKQKIGALQTKNQELIADNHVLKSMAADDYLVAGYKGKKDKLTLLARRTNKLTLGFDVPDDVNVNLKFTIIDPNGQRIENTENCISTQVVESEQSNMTSGTGETTVRLNKRIQMEYNPKAKFLKGIYKIEIFNNDNYLGSCQVQLK